MRAFATVSGVSAMLLHALLVPAACAAEAKAPAAVVLAQDCGAGVEPPQGKMPILVLTDRQYAKNPFGCYLVEILRSEGLVEFEQAERSALNSAADPAAVLAAHAVVLVAEMELTGAEERWFRDYVRGGGVLVAMRPDPDLADLFGVSVAGTRPERLLQHFAVGADHAAGKGIVRTALQYHGEATRYRLAGARRLASFTAGVGTPAASPAVTIQRHGAGAAVAFAFDLAKSTVLVRQGNPEWQDTEGDKFPGYRPMDMFERPDGRTWFDPNRLEIPQADEAQRFLANLVLLLAENPLPRMWYLPGTHKAIVVNTGDGENNYGPQISPVLDACASYGGAFSVYLMNWDRALGIERTTVAEEAAWRAAGHEVGVHVYGGGPEGAGAHDALRTAYGKIVADLESKFGHGARTARNHTVDWTGWVDMAAIEAQFGTGMDVNYSHFVLSDGARTSHGYFNGTGLPQRFSDASGRILPIYMATTQWMDQWFVLKKMTAEQTAGIIIGMLEAAEAGSYSAFVNCIHPCRYTGYGGKDKITPIWPHKVWKYCRDKGIPSWSAEMLLDFVTARNQARFENIRWAAERQQGTRRLTFDFRTTAGGHDLTLMIPRRWSGRTLAALSADGAKAAWTRATIKGIEYGMFTTTAKQAHVAAEYQAQ